MGMTTTYDNGEKLEYIRDCVVKRVTARHSGPGMDLLESQILRMSPEDLMGLPESTAIWIYEEFKRLMTAGLSAQQALTNIESHRSSLLEQEPNYSFKRVNEYADYRLQREHGHAELSDADITSILASAEFWAYRDELARNAQNLAWTVLPNMPHIMSKQPTTVFEWSGNMLLLVHDVPSVAEAQSGTKMPLRFPRVLVVVDLQTNQPRLMVTEEVGLPGVPFFCEFGANGVHVNHGQRRFRGDDEFLSTAFERCRSALKLQGTPSPQKRRSEGRPGFFKDFFR